MADTTGMDGRGTAASFRSNHAFINTHTNTTMILTKRRQPDTGRTDLSSNTPRCCLLRPGNCNDLDTRRGGGAASRN